MQAITDLFLKVHLDSDKEVGVNNYDGQLVVNAIQFPPEKTDSYVILPFHQWADRHSTAWWEAYTKLKHNRLANHREATLKNLIYAMAGTYIIITLREVDVFRSGGTRELKTSTSLSVMMIYVPAI